MHFHLSKGLISTLTLAGLCLSFHSATAPMPLPSAEATSTISARDLKRHLSFLASTELGGRYTISPSNLIAARYLASELEYYGFRGAASGSFFQKVPLVFRHIDAASSSLTIKHNAAGLSFKFGSDFIEPDAVDMKLGGQLVFAGVLSDYAMPALMGSTKFQLIAPAIYYEAITNSSWALAGAMATVVLGLVASFLIAANLLLKRLAPWALTL